MRIDTVILDPVRTLKQCVLAINELAKGTIVGGVGTFAQFVHIGPASIVDAIVASENQVVLHIVGGAVPGTGTAMLVLTSALPQVTHLIYANGGDRSLRILSNRNPDFSASDPTEPMPRLDFEQDGVISMSYRLPANTTPDIYDNLAGKSLVFRGGGTIGAGGIAGKYVQLGVGHLTRGLQLGVSDTVTNVVVPKIQIDPGAASDPLWLWVGGVLRQLTRDGGGFAKLS